MSRRPASPLATTSARPAPPASPADQRTACGRWAICVLGPWRLVAVGHDDAELAPPHLTRRKSEVLLAYLLLHPGPQPRDRLAGVLDPHAAAGDEARRLLRVVLADVRKQLGDDAVLGDRDHLSLHPAWREASDWHRCLKALQDGEIDQAERLVHGDLLQGHEADWLQPARTALRQHRVQALDRQVADLRAAGAYDAMCAAARRLLALDATHERAHQHLIFALLALGDRQAAMTQYTLCRQALADELGVSPSAETEALRHRVQRQADRALASRATNLPRPQTRFIGRDAVLERLEQLMQPGCLVTLHGMGGQGKTRLAVQAAEENGHGFPDGVWWLGLAALDSGESLDRTLARVLGIREPDADDPRQRVMQHLAARRCLLVLDNCEHLLAAVAERVAQWLAACPGIGVLATSRAPLGLAAEHCLAVPALAVLTGVGELAEWQANESLALLLDRSGLEPARTWASPDAQALVRVCRQLDGVPLALELAAAAIRRQGLTAALAALEALDRGLALSSAEPPSMGAPSGVSEAHAPAPRQRSLAAMLDWSHALLNPVEQAFLRRLAVFADSFDAEAACRVAGGWEDPHGPVAALRPEPPPPWPRRSASAAPPLPLATLPELPASGEWLTNVLLESLAQKSWLLRLGSEGPRATRWALLPLLREYARQRLADAGEVASLRQRHAQVFLDRCFDWLPHFMRAGEAQALDAIAADWPDLRTLLAWQAEPDHPWLLGPEFLGAVGRYWQVRGLYGEGAGWLERLRTHPGLGAWLPPRCELANTLGLMRWMQGRLDAARADFEEAVALYTTLARARSRLSAQNNLGCVLMEDGRHEAAEPLLAELVAMCRHEGLDTLLPMALNNLAASRLAQRRLDGVDLMLIESLALHERAGNAQGQIVSLTALGEYWNNSGQPARAREVLHRAGAMAAPLSHTRLILILLVTLAQTEWLRNEPMDAAQCLGLAKAMAERLQTTVNRDFQADAGRLEAELRRQLSEAGCTAAMARGAGLTPAEIFDRTSPAQPASPAKPAPA